MSRDVIIACDFNSKEEVLDFLSKFGEEKPFVKIGMELFYAEGPEIVKSLIARGHRIFLDLKLHDIPTTVKKSMYVLAKLGVNMVNVHAAGGSEMMKAAIEGLTEGAESEGIKRPKLIAVSQLTSTDQQMMTEELLIDRDIKKVVIAYAKNAFLSSLDGVVCSALESPLIHREISDSFLTVTPGIRLAGDSSGDQRRVTTPANAKELTSDYIVVGRSITKAEDPLSAYRKCISQFL